MTIDTAFPGGNIRVDRRDGDTFYVRQDLRDTPCDWFYWSFRVRGAEGRKLTFIFTAGDVMTSRGPAVSRDQGRTWAWLTRSLFDGPGFSYAFGSDEYDVRFALAPAYTQAHWQAFAQEHEHEPSFRFAELGRTRQGRAIPSLHAGQLNGTPRHRLVLTGRHHACESVANYTLEGFLEAVRDTTPTGREYRDNVEVLAVPFVDMDGVENGDQGKFRAPHDHYCDYGDQPIYEAPALLMKRIPDWAGGRLRLLLDLHCPMHRGAGNEQVLLVLGDGEGNRRNARRFAALLEANRTGLLPYSSSSLLAYGETWNVDPPPCRSSVSWAGQLPGVELSAVVEVPYAIAAGIEVNAHSARTFGRDLAAAACEFLTELHTA